VWLSLGYAWWLRLSSLQGDFIAVISERSVFSIRATTTAVIVAHVTEHNLIHGRTATDPIPSLRTRQFPAFAYFSIPTLLHRPHRPSLASSIHSQKSPSLVNRNGTSKSFMKPRWSLIGSTPESGGMGILLRGAIGCLRIVAGRNISIRCIAS
jgi:hypothetical protein